MKELRVTIASQSDAAMASLTARRLAEEAGLSLTQATAFATAASELCTNIVKYAGRGWMTLRPIEGVRRGVEGVIEDHGPGIADTELAMQQHHSTGGTLGLGLSGTQRLVDEFELRSELGKGTWARIAKYR